MADVGVGHRLEHVGRERLAGVAGPLLLLAPLVTTGTGPRSIGEELVGDELQHAIDADRPRRRRAQHRRDPRLREPPLDPVDDLVLGELALLEVLLDQGVVGLGDRLHQLLAERVGLARDVVGPLALLAFGPLP